MGDNINKKFLLGIAIVLVVILSVGIYIFYKTLHTEPNIKVSVDILPLTNEEYRDVGVKGLVNPKISDFKRFIFHIKVTNFPYFSDRKITIPKVQESLNLYDGNHRYWYGKSFSQDNKNESFAEYKYDFVFYEKGLDETKIREIYKSQVVVVSWTPVGESEKTKKYSIGDILEYKKMP